MDTKTNSTPNEIVKRLQAGETLMCISFSEGSYWYELGDHHFDYDDDPALGEYIDLAEKDGLIEEVQVVEASGYHKKQIVLTEKGKMYVATDDVANHDAAHHNGVDHE